MAKEKEIASTEQSTLSKAVKNVKQKLLTKQKKPEPKISIVSPTEKAEEVNFTRGIVYLGHIPHGFFEEQMSDYFKQFGKITRVRLVRSKKTGRSRGYGYVEFSNPEVARIAAESMNNYLMCGRLLKATYIPPEKQHAGFFIGRQWSKQNYPGLMNRAKQNMHKNKNVDNKVEASLVESGLTKISNIEKKLAAVGIVYKINPVEVPEKVVKKRKSTAKLTTTETKKKKLNATETEEEKSTPAETKKEKLMTNETEKKKLTTNKTEKKKLSANETKKKKLSANETEKKKLSAKATDKKILTKRVTKQKKLSTESTTAPKLKKVKKTLKLK